MCNRDDDIRRWEEMTGDEKHVQRLIDKAMAEVEAREKQELEREKNLDE